MTDVAVEKSRGGLLMGRRRARRWQVAIGLVIAITLTIFRLSMFSGLFGVVRVTGSSMAEAYCGEHIVVECADCGFTFRVDRAALGVERRVCPNCGYVNPAGATETILRGQRVLVDRLPVLVGRVRRLDVVALDDPDRLGERIIKRVVGLPHEVISLRDGDLYVDGAVVRKSYEQYRETAVLVHDDRFRPQQSKDAPARWSAAIDDTHWRALYAGYLCEVDADEPNSTNGSERRDRWDWLEYHHWSCCANPSPRFEPSAVLDNDSYNPTTSRNLQFVRDIGLSCALRCSSRAQVSIQIRSPSGVWELRLRCDDIGGELYRDRVLADKFKFSSFQAGRELALEFAICDQQLFLTTNGELTMVHAFDAAPGGTTAAAGGAAGAAAGAAHSPSPVAIGVFRELNRSQEPPSVQLSNLKIWRDIHYLGPRGSESGWSADPVPASELFVLGDNPPVSIDSRHWRPGTVTGAMLTGRVMKRRE